MKIKCYNFKLQNFDKIDTSTLLDIYADCCTCELQALCDDTTNIYFELLERGEDM